MNSDPRLATIEASALGQYLVSPPATSGPAPLLVGFHGYGENAERHLAELRQLTETSGWLTVSVDALHRFYDRKSGAVIGSWMTRENREAVIAHNIAYVRSVVAQVKQDWPTTGVLVYAGFSQGVAMAYRAAVRGGHPCRGILALAGDIPPELANDTSVGWPPVFVARGHSDAWYTQAKMDADLAVLNGPTTVESLVFSGGHEWVDEVRHAAGRFLARCRTRTTPA